MLSKPVTYFINSVYIRGYSYYKNLNASGNIYFFSDLSHLVIFLKSEEKTADFNSKVTLTYLHFKLC